MKLRTRIPGAAGAIEIRRTKSIEIPELGEWEIERFWRKVSKGGDDDCWLWLGGTSDKGYGRFKIRGKLYSPHRIAYSLIRGEIPQIRQYHGTVVIHSCDEPRCCNPAHLSAGTQLKNVRDMDAKGRRGINPSWKIPTETVRALRAASGTLQEISAQFGVAPAYVKHLRAGRGRPDAIVAPPVNPVGGV